MSSITVEEPVLFPRWRLGVPGGCVVRLVAAAMCAAPRPDPSSLVLRLSDVGRVDAAR
jgi:hypothetical protein